jgi:protein SCO1
MRATAASIPALSACVAIFLGTPGATAAGRWGADYFPDVSLTTQDGKAVRFYEDLIKGKAVAINLIYTRCTANCPLETAKLAQVQRILGDRVGKDIFFYSITIDPEHDTPEALKAYAEKFHAGPGWLFLTGKEEDIRLVSSKLGLSSVIDRASRDGHMPTLMIGNEPTGEWMRNSAVDNPRFLATTMINFFGRWKAGRPANSYADAHRVRRPGKAEVLFRSRCSACHTIGMGDGLGPDLDGVTARRDRAWLVRYIAEPDRVLAGNDPIAVELFAKYRSVRMPNLQLSSEEVGALLRYLEEEGRAAASRSAAPVRNAAMP